MNEKKRLYRAIQLMEPGTIMRIPHPDCTREKPGDQCTMHHNIHMAQRRNNFAARSLHVEDELWVVRLFD